MFNYTLLVYKLDSTFDTGYRLVKTIPYKGVSGNFMMDEIFCLRRGEYPTKDGWMLTFTETENLTDYFGLCNS
jgi:hypothetical protein